MTIRNLVSLLHWEGSSDIMFFHSRENDESSRGLTFIVHVHCTLHDLHCRDCRACMLPMYTVVLARVTDAICQAPFSEALQYGFISKNILDLL